MISSFKENPQYFSQAVRDLRREIYSIWATKDADTFREMYVSQSGPNFNMSDIDSAVAPFTKKILENACSEKENLFFLQALFAPHFKGPLEEFFSSPDFSEANRQFQNNFDHPFYGNLFKGLFGKDITSDYFDRLEKDLNVPINENLQVNEPFFPSKAFLRKNFEGELWTILKSPTQNPFHENIFTQFIESNTADAITIIHRLRKLILKEQHQQIKIGYVSYKSIPLAAWRFLYGKPYPAENFTWQELFDMVYERFTKKGSLIKFLVIFQDATSKNFTNDKWALRILWTYHAIVRYHALNHPEECLKAIDQNLIHEAGFAKIVRREIKRRKKNISWSLAPTITTLATNISSDPLIEEETPTVFEGVLAKDETSLLDHQKTSVIKQDPLIINLAYFSDSESEDEWPIMEFANNEDLDFPAGHSDFLHEYVRLFLSSPPNKPIAGQYFAGLFGDFVSPTKIVDFLKFHEEYLHLDAVFQKSYDCIDALLTQRNQLLTMLESCSPKLAAWAQEELHYVLGAESLRRPHGNLENVLLDDQSFHLCRDHISLMRFMEDGRTLTSSEQQRYVANRDKIPLAFDSLVSRISMEKSNLKDDIEYCSWLSLALTRENEKLSQLISSHGHGHY